MFAARLRELGEDESLLIEPMVQRAAAYLARAGPVSPQDRWEENPGASPFTLAVSVAALTAAAVYWLEGHEREYALALADCWNERIEEWRYVAATELAQTHRVAGYYVRIGPAAGTGGLRGSVEIANRGDETLPASALVGLDFLYLARLGLRRIDDPRMLETLTVADALLQVETSNGPAYRRYDDDGYGEHADGSPFDGTGIGRPWPLLAGERGHGALLQGEPVEPYL